MKRSYLVYGEGVNDGSKPSKRNGKHLKEYLVWRAMICRCYSKYSLDLKPSYTKTEVSENFKSYAYFYDWCQNQIGFKSEGFVFDKDILGFRYNIYSENVCAFIPQTLNKLLTLRQRDRSRYGLGVRRFTRSGNTLKFKSSIGAGISGVDLLSPITFDTALEAHEDYVQRKTAFIIAQAEAYKTVLDPRVYLALLTPNLKERISCLN